MTKGLVALIGAGAIAAAAAGGYVALRRNAVDAVAALPPSQPEAAAPQVPESRPIREEPKAATARRERPAERTPSRRPAGSSVSAQAPVAEQVTNVLASAPAAQTTAPIEASKAPANETPWNEPMPAPVYEAPKVQLEQLTVEPDSVIGIRLDSAVASETARVEDRVTARVSRDVTVDGHTAVSSGARLEGVIVSIERGGRFKDRARVGLRFQSLVLADGTRLPIETETIFRESESPAAPAAAKVGATAAIGGILGAMLGGGKGAAIGTAVGAGGGSAAVRAGAPANAVLPAGTPLTVRLTAPLTITIQRSPSL
jgi:hypothetical protein